MGVRFTARVAAPVLVFVALWALCAAALRFQWVKNVPPDDAIEVVAGTGIVVLLITLILIGVYGLGVTRELTTARNAADEVRRSAAEANAAQEKMRDGLRQVLVSLGKRNSSLLHRQLRILDELEKQANSPQALADLFALDHLTTRMRRHAESLTIVAGSAPARPVSDPVPVIDVIRAAAAEVEDYKRVAVITDADAAIAAPAVTDMIHLLSELIENATLFSPSATRVEVKAESVANGFAIEVEDRGLGIAAEQMSKLNAQLADPPDFDAADADRLGLFVVGRLAARHGVQVSLNPSAYRGTKAVLILPESVVTAAPVQEQPAPREDLPRRESLSLVGAGAPADEPAPPALERRVKPARTEELDRRAAPERAAVDPDAGRTLHGLPRRVRPDADRPESAAAPERRERPEPADAPAPEHARNLAASLQSSWQRSRHNNESEDD
jgi:signal transduction histidine kinase